MRPNNKLIGLDHQWEASPKEEASSRQEASSQEEASFTEDACSKHEATAGNFRLTENFNGSSENNDCRKIIFRRSLFPDDQVKFSDDHNFPTVR